MPVKGDREYRAMQMALKPIGVNKKMDTDHYVEGYATTFDDPYLLIQTEEFEVYEQISRDALDEADMSDVKFQVNHEGTVYARMKQKTLGIELDSKGIFVYADLSKTTSARERYEEIEAGYIDKMSWAFTVRQHEFKWNKEMTVCTRTIQKVKKMYEVSGVTEPANPKTELEAKSMGEIKDNTGEIHIISARSLLDGVIESREQELLRRKELDNKKRKLKLKVEVLK